MSGINTTYSMEIDSGDSALQKGFLMAVKKDSHILLYLCEIFKKSDVKKAIAMKPKRVRMNAKALEEIVLGIKEFKANGEELCLDDLFYLLLLSVV